VLLLPGSAAAAYHPADGALVEALRTCDPAAQGPALWLTKIAMHAADPLW
jgi:hypothetical protein